MPFLHYRCSHIFCVFDHCNPAPADPGDLLHQIRIRVLLIDADTGNSDSLSNGFCRLLDGETRWRRVRCRGIAIRDENNVLLAVTPGVPGKKAPGRQQPTLRLLALLVQQQSVDRICQQAA